MVERPERGRGAGEMPAAGNDEDNGIDLTRVFNPYGSKVVLSQHALLEVWGRAQQNPGMFNSRGLVNEDNTSKIEEKKRADALFQTWLASMSESYRRSYDQLMFTIEEAHKNYGDMRQRASLTHDWVHNAVREMEEDAFKLPDGRMVFRGPRGFFVDQDGIALSAREQEEMNRQDPRVLSRIREYDRYQRLKQHDLENEDFLENIDADEQNALDMQAGAESRQWTQEQIGKSDEQIRFNMGQNHAQLERMEKEAAEDQKSGMSVDGSAAKSKFYSVYEDGEGTGEVSRPVGRTASVAGVIDGHNGVRGEKITPAFTLSGAIPSVGETTGNTIKSGGKDTVKPAQDEQKSSPTQDLCK